jgi:hypothetical protein
MSEEEVIESIERVVSLLGRRFVFGYNQLDDALQEGRIFALELLKSRKYDPARGPLDAFLYKHVFRRYINQKRDLIRRTDAPCAACYRGQPCGPDGRPCQKFAAWNDRQHRKAALAAAAAHEPFDDEHAERQKAPPADEVAAHDELLRLIDERLDVEHRRLLLQMRDGLVVPKRKRVVVEQAVLSILAEAGLSREDMGLADGGLDAEPTGDAQQPPTAA